MTLGFGIIPKEIASSDVEIETETTDVSVLTETGCDEGPCRNGFAIGEAAICGASAVVSAVGAFSCTAGAVFTFGLSCALGLAAIALWANHLKG